MVTFSLDVLHLYISMRQGGIQSPFRCSAVVINGLKCVSNFCLISAMFLPWFCRLHPLQSPHIKALGVILYQGNELGMKLDHPPIYLPGNTIKIILNIQIPIR